MTRYMYDSDVASDIPTTAKVGAAYVDGAANFNAMVARLPHSQHLPISIHGAKAKAYDSEHGALSIAAAVDCAKRDIAAGEDLPWVYFSTSNYDAVKAECVKAGIYDKVWFWGAHYGLTDAEAADLINSGQRYCAVQNVAAGYGATGHWDRSVLAPYIAGFDPVPQTALSVFTRSAARRATRLLTGVNGRLAHRTHPTNAAGEVALTALDDACYLVRKQIKRVKSL